MLGLVSNGLKFGDDLLRAHHGHAHINQHRSNNVAKYNSSFGATDYSQTNFPTMYPTNFSTNFPTNTFY